MAPIVANMTPALEPAPTAWRKWRREKPETISSVAMRGEPLDLSARRAAVPDPDAGAPPPAPDVRLGRARDARMSSAFRLRQRPTVSGKGCVSGPRRGASAEPLTPYAQALAHVAGRHPGVTAAKRRVATFALRSARCRPLPGIIGVPVLPLEALDEEPFEHRHRR